MRVPSASETIRARGPHRLWRIAPRSPLSLKGANCESTTFHQSLTRPGCSPFQCQLPAQYASGLKLTIIPEKEMWGEGEGGRSGETELRLLSMVERPL